MPSAGRLDPAGFASVAAMQAETAPGGAAQPVAGCAAGGGGGSGGAASAMAGEPPPAPVDPAKTWIEITLVDKAGAPVAFEEYAIRTPAGDTVGGALDEDGFARVDGLDPGQCEVGFPRIDGRLWRRR